MMTQEENDLLTQTGRGDVPLTGKPLHAARRILAKATDEIRLQLRVSADAAMKKLNA